tara:strand:+ start:844 stop:1062 length:219 start_codon:yes stop_codon:yes gene_type:complete
MDIESVEDVKKFVALCRKDGNKDDFINNGGLSNIMDFLMYKNSIRFPDVYWTTEEVIKMLEPILEYLKEEEN